MFKRELRLAAWGANIRMAIATVIVFWTPVEILGRVNFFTEIWIYPERYKGPMIAVFIAFLILLAGLLWAAKRKKCEPISAHNE